MRYFCVFNFTFSMTGRGVTERGALYVFLGGGRGGRFFKQIIQIAIIHSLLAGWQIGSEVCL